MGELLNYHRQLFQWHCRKFFRFRRHLSKREKDYLEVCFSLAQDFCEVSESGYRHFSYYSYSHRIEGERVNSSRLAYGSVLQPALAWEAALLVVLERGIELPPFFLEFADSQFYGLGWDILEGQFKVYFRVQPMTALPPEILACKGELDPSTHRPEGLVSFTYRDNLKVETKLYFYPEAPLPLPEGTRGQATMTTDQRGVVPQYDLSDPDLWQQRLSPAGQRIVALYRELGESLDTIAYQDSQRYTLYFP